MNTRNGIRTLMALFVTALAILCLPSTSQGGAGNIFSINFYMYPWPWTSQDQFETITLEEDQAAGYDDWLTNDWINYSVPWAPTAPDDPITIVSNKGSEATFQLITCRNGGAYIWTNPRTTLLGDGNADMMDGHINSTENEGKLADLEVTNIPFANYEVIVYLGSQTAQWGDGTGLITFNGSQRAFSLGSDAPFSGFTEIVNDTDPGNFIVYKDLTDPSISIQTQGNGFNHLGLTGLQIRELNDPNGPAVDAGGDWITWLGEPVTLDATVSETPTTTWNLNDLAYSWTTPDDPKVDVVISNAETLSPTVTITKLPELVPYHPNPSFELVTPQSAINTSRDFWGRYNRPAGTDYNTQALQYALNSDFHFPDGPDQTPDGNVACRACTNVGDSQPDGPAIMLEDVLFDPTATYELSVAVGHPFAINGSTAYNDDTWRGYLVQLVVGGTVESIGAGADNIYGGTVIAEDANSIDIPKREWRTSTISYTPNGEFDDLAGQPIQIRLLAMDDPDPAYFSQTKVFYDDVQFTINGELGEYVIDPAVPGVDLTLTVTEVSTGNTANGYVTIDAYDDACAARIAKYPDYERNGFDTGDINQDCMTDLIDYALFSQSWLLSYASTEPAPIQ